MASDNRGKQKKSLWRARDMMGPPSRDGFVVTLLTENRVDSGQPVL
jgi:hypothetical protein